MVYQTRANWGVTHGGGHGALTDFSGSKIRSVSLRKLPTCLQPAVCGMF